MIPAYSLMPKKAYIYSNTNVVPVNNNNINKTAVINQLKRITRLLVHVLKILARNN